MKTILKTVNFFSILLLLFTPFMSCETHLDEIEEKVANEEVNEDIGVIDFSGRRVSGGHPSLSRIERGGSNYSVYDVRDYINTPGTGDEGWTTENLNLVIGEYHLNPYLVNKQLQNMYNNGQRKIALPIWYDIFSPNNNDPTSTNSIRANRGRMVPQHEANFKNVLKKIKEIGYNEVVIRFASQGASDPGNWGNSWNEYYFQKNWNFIYNSIKTSNSILLNTSIRVMYDLDIEMGGKDTNNSLVKYQKKLWQNYVYIFGNRNCFGFSVIASGGKNKKNNSRMDKYINYMSETGFMPHEFAIDIYAKDGRETLEKLKNSYNSLSRNGQPTRSVVILETHYNDMDNYNDLTDAIVYTGINVRTIYQWQLTRRQKKMHFDVNYPANFDQNLRKRPVVTRAGSGCDDRYCIWIAGFNFEEGASVDIRHPSNWGLIASYKANDLVVSYNSSLKKEIITLKLKSSYERSLFASSGLRVYVVNPQSSLWKGAGLVKR